MEHMGPQPSAWKIFFVSLRASESPPLASSALLVTTPLKEELEAWGGNEREKKTTGGIKVDGGIDGWIVCFLMMSCFN